MPGHTLIDGNNLLHAMHAHAPVPNVGRETLVRIVERWAYRGEERITLVFDGAGPHGELARQMASKRIKVVFSAPQTADDVIVEKLRHAKFPLSMSVVTDDQAIGHEARRRRSGHVGCRSFIDALFSPERDDPNEAVPGSGVVDEAVEKPESVSEGEIDHWVELFEEEDDPEDWLYR